MWKKNEPGSFTSQAPTHMPVSQPERSRKELSTIGSSITIHGELSGNENLEVHGKLEGTVSLKKHNVLIGESGRVKADINAKSIRVGGEVKGNLFGEDEVIILQSGRVEGDIKAARVTLENGSKFKGSIDMEPKGDEKERSSAEDAAAKAAKSPENGRLAAQSSSLTSRSTSPV